MPSAYLFVLNVSGENTSEWEAVKEDLQNLLLETAEQCPETVEMKNFIHTVQASGQGLSESLAN